MIINITLWTRWEGFLNIPLLPTPSPSNWLPRVQVPACSGPEGPVPGTGPGNNAREQTLKHDSSVRTTRPRPTRARFTLSPSPLSVHRASVTIQGQEKLLSTKPFWTGGLRRAAWESLCSGSGASCTPTRAPAPSTNTTLLPFPCAFPASFSSFT